MNAVFKDMQDHSSRLDGATVHDRKELFALLDSIRDRQPFGCELVGENDYKLTLGIGEHIGFVQHSPADGDTPYLLAVAPEKCCEQEYVEFLVGDTPTPIPQRFFLPFEAVKRIAAYFIETGERSPAFSWEEI
jgi:hypothetical protein